MTPAIHRTRWREVEGEVLDERELERASRFILPVDRGRFVAAHTFLRRTLGRLVEQDPAALSFAYGEHGKPSLVGASLHFSLTHAGGWVAVATSERTQVGIDVEEINPATDLDLTGRAVLTKRELELLSAASGDESRRTFFRLWTCKEAALKAWGVGLSVDPRETDLSLAVGSSDIAIRHATLGTLKLRQFRCDDTHVGAVAWLRNET